MGRKSNYSKNKSHMGSLLASQGAWVHMPPPHWPLGSRGGALWYSLVRQDSSLRSGHEDRLRVSLWLCLILWLHKLALAKKLSLVNIFPLYIKSYWGRPFLGLSWYLLQKNFHLGVLQAKPINPKLITQFFSYARCPASCHKDHYRCSGQWREPSGMDGTWGNWNSRVMGVLEDMGEYCILVENLWRVSRE